MKILAAIVVLFWLGAYAAWRSANRGPRDDFGAGALAFILLCAATLLTLVYLGLAFWLRSFL